MSNSLADAKAKSASTPVANQSGPVLKIVEHASSTITRADLAMAVYQKVGLSRKESAHLVEVVLAEICDTLAAGENVKLSSFGSFMIRSKGQRVGRNPKTGVEVPITPRRVMVFKPSNIMKARLNHQTLEGIDDHD